MERIDLTVFLGDELSHHPLPSSGQVKIGRAPDSDVQIDDTSVSRRHAVLHVGPPLRVEDLGSANGTIVRRPGGGASGAEIDTHELQRRPGETFEVALGDRIILGAATAVVRRAPTTSSTLSRAATDPAMRALHDQARRAAQGMIGVLILGETGAGKEVLAREIHRLSPRAAGLFLAVHCAALSESLLEGELFGYEKGAFTGAVQARPGLFEAADGGTLLLDEIGELTQAVQVKLLRVLEERAVIRIGARAPRRINVRFLAATNCDLGAEVARGGFRRDLFYRLAGITLEVPPLRARPGEIADLARAFLAEACHAMHQSRTPDLSPTTITLLERHDWPGNVRELRNAMERAAVLCDGPAVLPQHLPAAIAGSEDGAEAPESEAGSALVEPSSIGPSSIEAFDAEREAFLRHRIVEALEQCGGNQTRAAELVGISRRTLVSRIKEYGLPRPKVKA